MRTWAFSKENENPKKPLASTLTAFDTGDDKLWGHERGLGWGAVNFGTVTRKHTEEPRGRAEPLSRSVCTGPFQHRLPASGYKNVLLVLVQQEHLSCGRYDLLLGRRGEIREPFLHLPFFTWPLVQNNQMPKASICSERVLRPISCLKLLARLLGIKTFSAKYILQWALQ